MLFILVNRFSKENVSGAFYVRSQSFDNFRNYKYIACELVFELIHFSIQWIAMLHTEISEKWMGENFINVGKCSFYLNHFKTFSS